MANGAINYTLGLDNSRFLSATRDAQRAVSSMAGSIASSVASIAKVGLAAGAVGGLTAGFMGLKKAITAAADMESLTTAFATVLGSAGAARDVLAEISALAARTPYGVTELAQAARSLFAVTDREDITQTLTMIGDLASAAQKPVTDLASMYAKIKGGDQVYGEDLNQIADALGGKALQEFVKVLGVDSVGAVRKLASDGKITGAVLEQVFRNLTAQGGMAFGAMAAQSTTFNGLLSTLKDSFDGLFRTIGQPINDFLKPVLEGGIRRLDILGNAMKAFVQLMDSARQDGQLGDFLGNGLVIAAKEGVNVFSSGIRGAVAYLAAALPAVFAVAQDSLLGQRFAIAVESIFRGAGDIFNAAIREGIADLMQATGQVFDAGEWRAAAAADRDRAGNRMQTAYGAIAGINGRDVTEMAARILDAHNQGAAAFEGASKAKVFDTTADFQKLKGQGMKLNPQAWKAFEDAVQGKLPAAVEGATRVLKPAAEGAARALEKVAAVNRTLGGGGGGFAPILAEADEARRGLKSKTQSSLDQANRRSAYDMAKNPYNLKGLNRFNEDFARRFPVAGLKVPQDAAAGQGAQMSRREKQAAAMMSKSEQLLTSIDQRLAALGLAS